MFTNDDDTVDTNNLAFVDSRSRAAGVLIRHIIGKTDDEFSRAWNQHCAVDDLEAKMNELAALKPEKISEIQYRDARLTELRTELAMLKQSASDGPLAQSLATPAPVAPSASDAPASDPPPVATRRIAFAFPDLRGWNEKAWKDNLGSPPKWLQACIFYVVSEA